MSEVAAVRDDETLKTCWNCRTGQTGGSLVQPWSHVWDSKHSDCLGTGQSQHAVSETRDLSLSFSLTFVITFVHELEKI